jgi:hypothetical protein
MAEKGWIAQAGAAAGIAAGAGAAQLGLGYGLGVIEWPVTPTASDSIWLNSLGWATWITASATVLGAVIAGRLRADLPGRWRVLWRVALSASAALGALVSVALVALPARSAVRTDTLSPQLVAVGYALIGLVAGMIVAFWAVSSPPAAANLLGTAAWLWALAVAGVAAELTTHRASETYLTSWQFVESQSPTRYGGIYWPSAALTLVAAFLIGLILAWPATRRGDVGLGTATSGAVGPLLVAIAFLALSPLITEAAGPLQSAYLIAPYAVLAGLAGSALTVSLAQATQSRVPRQPNGPRELGPAPATAPTRGTAATADEAPTAIGVAKPTTPVAPKPAPEAPENPAGRRWLFSKRRPSEAEAAPLDVDTKSRSGKPSAAPSPGPVGRKAPLPRDSGSSLSKGSESSLSGDPGTSLSTGPRSSLSKDPEASLSKDPALAADPEIAAAARPAKNATKRTAARKEAAPRSTITPPPANPPIARINPKD